MQHLQVKGATGAAVNKDSDGCSSSRVQQPGCSLTAVSGLTSDLGGGVRSRCSTHMCRVEVLQPDQHLVANPLHVRHLHTAAARRRSGSRGVPRSGLGVCRKREPSHPSARSRRDLGEISTRTRGTLGEISARSRRGLTVIVCGEAISLRKSRSTKSKTTHRSEKADSDCGRSTCSGCTSPSLPVSPHLSGLGQRSRHLVVCVSFLCVSFLCVSAAVNHP